VTGTVAQPSTRPGQDSDRLELVVLDVSRIHPYEHNPRRAPNAEYDRIKASIRADGLGQPLVVTHTTLGERRMRNTTASRHRSAPTV